MWILATNHLRIQVRFVEHLAETVLRGFPEPRLGSRNAIRRSVSLLVLRLPLATSVQAASLFSQSVTGIQTGASRKQGLNNGGMTPRDSSQRRRCSEAIC